MSAEERHQTGFLNPPDKKSQPFSRHYLESVFCEIRFPSLLELETEIPIDFQKAWRKRFPIYEQGKSGELSQAGLSKLSTLHHFGSRDGRWKLSLGSSSLSLATSKYQSFAELVEQVGWVVEQSASLLDTDFFTRIGMRYINKISAQNSYSGLQGAVNSEIAATHATGVFGQVGSLKTQVQGNVQGGGSYHFQYGIAVDQKESTEENVVNAIVLDFDYSDAGVQVEHLISTLERFHEVHFKFFWWTLGQASRQYLVGKHDENS